MRRAAVIALALAAGCKDEAPQSKPAPAPVSAPDAAPAPAPAIDAAPPAPSDAAAAVPTETADDIEAQLDTMKEELVELEAKVDRGAAAVKSSRTTMGRQRANAELGVLRKKHAALSRQYEALADKLQAIESAP